MPHSRAPHSEDDGYEARGSSAFSRFLSGLAAFSVGVFICGACSSYSAGDPSFNMAVARVRDAATGLVTEASPENMFGIVGASFGDLLMQGFGWTAILLGFGLMIGGVRRAFAIGQQDPAAWMWGLAAILFAACCLAEWPIPKSWEMSAGLGGVVGVVEADRDEVGGQRDRCLEADVGERDARCRGSGRADRPERAGREDGAELGGQRRVGGADVDHRVAVDEAEAGGTGVGEAGDPHCAPARPAAIASRSRGSRNSAGGGGPHAKSDLSGAQLRASHSAALGIWSRSA